MLPTFGAYIHKWKDKTAKIEPENTRLKNKFENNSTWEGVFYQKKNDSSIKTITQVELFSFFHFMCVAANASELSCVAHLANIERFL